MFYDEHNSLNGKYILYSLWLYPVYFYIWFFTLSQGLLNIGGHQLRLRCEVPKPISQNMNNNEIFYQEDSLNNAPYIHCSTILVRLLPYTEVISNLYFSHNSFCFEYYLFSLRTKYLIANDSTS